MLLIFESLKLAGPTKTIKKYYYGILISDKLTLYFFHISDFRLRQVTNSAIRHYGTMSRTSNVKK